MEDYSYEDSTGGPPPPPPAPGPPPPPPMASKVGAPAPPSGQDRVALLSQIQAGKSLKKTQTKDSSSPLLKKDSSSSGGGGGSSAGRGGGMNPLFPMGVPSLASLKKTSVTPRASPSPAPVNVAPPKASAAPAPKPTPVKATQPGPASKGGFVAPVKSVQLGLARNGAAPPSQAPKSSAPPATSYSAPKPAPVSAPAPSFGAPKTSTPPASSYSAPKTTTTTTTSFSSTSSAPASSYKPPSSFNSAPAPTPAPAPAPSVSSYSSSSTFSHIQPTPTYEPPSTYTSYEPPQQKSTPPPSNYSSGGSTTISLSVPHNTCSGCGGDIPITQRSLEWNKMHFHDDCFRCAHCKTFLGTISCYVNGSEPWCVNCYDNLHSKRCDDCGGILEGEYLSSGDKHYHAEHFKCAFCKDLLGMSYFNVLGSPACESCARTQKGR